MEAEKAKEEEEALSEKLHDYENRLQELQSAYLDEKKNNTCLQMELKKIKEQNESFEKVISKFHEIRERATGFSGHKPLENKCASLLEDPEEMWIFDSDGKHAPSSYIDSLEEQIVSLKESVDSLQKKMLVGMEIEQHLRKRVHQLEKKQINAGKLLGHCLLTLRDLHNQLRAAIMNILEVETTEMKSILVEVQEKMKLLHMSDEMNLCAPLGEEKGEMSNCQREDINSDADFNAVAKEEYPVTLSIPVNDESDMSSFLAQALKEKVEVLLLLSQQEERHLLERDLNQKKMEDLQRNLVQVTTEKVQALVELAQLKRDYQLLQVSSRYGMKHVNYSADDGDKNIVAQERNAKLKNLLKKTYLRRWVGKDSESESDIHSNLDGSSPTSESSNYPMDLARMKVENATLQESIANMSHLTSSIHKLRLSLLKVINDSRAAASAERLTMALGDIFHEVDHVKTALSSSLPVSWSSVAEGTLSEQNSDDQALCFEVSKNERLDPIIAAGIEMVELLLLATELVRQNMVTGASSLLS